MGKNVGVGVGTPVGKGEVIGVGLGLTDGPGEVEGKVTTTLTCLTGSPSVVTETNAPTGRVKVRITPAMVITKFVMPPLCAENLFFVKANGFLWEALVY